MFEKEPFQYGGALAKERGLNWDGVDLSEWPTLTAFLNRATHRDPAQRFASRRQSLAALKATPLIVAPSGAEPEKPVSPRRGCAVKLV